jgi:glucosamine--fructose-6-phosphate aminotransferase (isomerizing)
LLEVDADITVVGPALAGNPRVGRLALPAGLAEPLSPLIEIIPLQLLAREISVVRGNDPDAPRGLRKVTETW